MTPVLTFALFAFNHEKFIAEAVQAAFEQTYSPLEIILTDDASTDRTYEIMRGMAARYQGPHQIILNRNKVNHGLANHVNKIARMARGKLIVAAGGDDISLPERTASLFEAWDAAGRRPHCVHSRVIHIDAAAMQIAPPEWEISGEPTHCIITHSPSPSQYVETQKPEIYGSTCAWSPELFKRFGGLPADVIHEDNAILLRSVLLGPILLVDTPLVKYRCHAGNLFNARKSAAHTLSEIREQEKRMRRNFRRRAIMHRVFCEDLSTAHASHLVTPAEFSKAYAIARHKERLFSLQSEFLGAPLARRVAILAILWRDGAESAQMKQLLPRLLTPPVFLAAKCIKRWLSFLRRSASAVKQ